MKNIGTDSVIDSIGISRDVIVAQEGGQQNLLPSVKNSTRGEFMKLYPFAEPTLQEDEPVDEPRTGTSDEAEEAVELNKSDSDSSAAEFEDGNFNEMTCLRFRRDLID